MIDRNCYVTYDSSPVTRTQHITTPRTNTGILEVKLTNPAWCCPRLPPVRGTFTLLPHNQSSNFLPNSCRLPAHTAASLAENSAVSQLLGRNFPYVQPRRASPVGAWCLACCGFGIFDIATRVISEAIRCCSSTVGSDNEQSLHSGLSDRGVASPIAPRG